MIMSKQNITTRIAPSPTGLFHIGTARTALFNYLFAKKYDGKFILRIEDTDEKRSKKEYEKDIIEGLKWLNLNWDGEIYYQSQRKAIYDKYIEKLLKEGKAYKEDGAIWFKLSSYSKKLIEYEDLVLGKLKFDKNNFNDFVLIKSDGVPLYMFAAVVDDYEMGITHVIRGDDHVNSTPQQIMLYEALGFKLPKFAHIPMILNSDRTKMSKRKNPVSLTSDFRDKGYLPEAIVNYISLLGWNPKSDKEKFSLAELIKEFDLKKINKSGAIFDMEKLNYFNKLYMRELKDDTLINMLYKINNKYKTIDREFLTKITSIEVNRISTINEFPKMDSFYFRFDEKYNKDLLIFKKSDKAKTLDGLNKAKSVLENADINDWKTIESLNLLLKNIIDNSELKPGDVFWPVRAALSGLDKSPSPIELLWVFGKDESLRRINTAIEKLSK